VHLASGISTYLLPFTLHLTSTSSADQNSYGTVDPTRLFDLERTPSRAYRDGTKEAIQQVLTEVESQYPYYLSKDAHGCFLVVLLIICTYRRSIRYTYCTAIYARIIRSKFNHHLKKEDTGGELAIICEG
jgi:hypothetical protein